MGRPPNRVTHPRDLVIVHEVTVKKRLHEVVEAMTEEEAAETLRALETTRDPLARILADAPIDDEPFTQADAAALAEAEAGMAEGRTVSWDELREESR